MGLSQNASSYRKSRRLLKWVCLGLAGIIITGGLVIIFLNSGTTRIESAVVARGYDDATGATGAGTTFTPQDNPLHCVVSLVRASKGTIVRMSWFAVEAGDLRNYKLLEREVDIKSNESAVDAFLELQHPWPTGSYKIDIYLDGHLERTLFFNIAEPVRTGLKAYFVQSM